MTTVTPPSRRRFLGLHGKLVAALFIAITGIMVSLSTLIYQNTLRDYRVDAAKELQRLQITFQTLLERSNRELFRYADQYAILKYSALAGKDLPPPSLLSSIESIYYFDNRGKTLAVSAHQSGSGQPDPRQIHTAVNSIVLTQRPFATLSCERQCTQSVYIPIISDDGHEYVININRSASLLLQDFYAITETDLILLVPDTARQDTLVLRGNTVQRGALTAYPNESAELIAAVKSAAENKEFLGDRSAVRQSVGQLNSHHYAMRLFHINTGETAAPLLAAVVKDTSRMRLLIEQAFHNWLVATVLQISIALILIYLILRPPLRRLKELTGVLQLLPQKQYLDAGKWLNALKRETAFPDEIDVLRDTLAEANASLESLNIVVETHRDALRSKIEDLSKASDFTKKLLDNSPLVIVIHDVNGRVLNINALGRTLTGLDFESEKYFDINEFLLLPTSESRIARELTGLFRGDTRQVQNEYPLITKDRRHLDFLWIHSLIKFNDQDMFMSAGMDITERRQAAESLNWLGQHDRVTGLLNRGTFIERASDFIHRHHNRETIQLLMLDIDDFAAFNDKFGFEQGDQLLSDISHHIANALPSGSMIARTGAGEFCALIHGNPMSDAQLAPITRYRGQFGSSYQEVNLSAVVDDYRQNIGEIDEWLSNITSIMLRVKQKSRGELYHAKSQDEDSHNRRERYAMRDLLLDALENNRLTLFYQPIFNLAENRVSHCECLVRMLDADGQFIPPGRFLGVAAEFGLLSRIDYTVMELAMQQQYQWAQRGIDTGLSINMTAPTIEQADFQQRIRSLIQQTGANPRHLIFEVVETDALENIDTARDLLATFKDVGAKIAFDDFGVGFTSFEYVRELPVDYLKIDQSFIRFLQEREDDQKLVKSMIDMSHSLGKKVIAEGVETAAALDILRSLGAEYVQGYYISRPLPIDGINLKLQIGDGNKILSPPDAYAFKSTRYVPAQQPFSSRDSGSRADPPTSAG